MSRRSASALTSLLLTSGLLAGCGTGLEAQTYKSRTPHNSTSAQVGDIGLRNLAVAAPAEGESLAAGGRAVVTGTFVNDRDVPDALIDASSDVASSVVLQTGGEAATVVIPPRGSSGSDWSLVLDGLTRDLRPGTYISLTLVFEKAGRTTVQIPVRVGDNGLSEREAEQDPYGEG